MLRRLHVENFKSIERLDFEPGRFNVLIGENGSGKSNVLEALAFAGGAVSGKLDNEFLVSRGMRVTEARFMRSALRAKSVEEIRFAIVDGEVELEFDVIDDSNSNYPRWRTVYAMPPREPRFLSRQRTPHWAWSLPSDDEFRSAFVNVLSAPQNAGLAERLQSGDEDAARIYAQSGVERIFAAVVGATIKDGALSLTSFLAYSPEASALRTFEREGQILPLGIAGEGLFKLLQVLAAEEKDPARWADLKENLRLLDWFESIDVPAASGAIQERSVRLRDRFIPAEMGYFDQRSANEAFLFILFYLALFVSSDTPALFGIDNIDASLNPKTCRELTRRLTHLAKKYDKQVVATTHNPAVLDGLDLNDDEQRLFVVRRGRKGDTKLRRVLPPKPVAGEQPLKLSEAFLRGLLGGLPQNF